MTNPLTVTELTADLKKQLEMRYSAVFVRGEVSNLKEQASGHIYFTLKDSEAQISAVLFRGDAKMQQMLPKAGDHVLVKGSISVYAPRGNYQIIVRELHYAGVGELLLKHHQLKNKLDGLGWFDPKHKKPLPKLPKTIGVVTSPTGSVIQDILHVLSKRFSGFHLILYPVKVQGDGAAAEIAQAIVEFNRYKLADVLIVGRGGGSLEDLWAFNEEVVAAAIFHSTIPIISAVGHETDFSISDFVADVRAPTPSAAATLVIAEKKQYQNNLERMQQLITQCAKSKTSQSSYLLQGICRQPLFTTARQLLGNYFQHIDTLSDDLHMSLKEEIAKKRLQLLSMHAQLQALNPAAQVKTLQQKLHHFDKAITSSLHHQIHHLKTLLHRTKVQEPIAYMTQRAIAQKKERFLQLISHLKAIDPKNLLTKGYCILFPENSDSIILSKNELSIGDKINVLLHDGKLTATLNQIEQ